MTRSDGSRATNTFDKTGQLVRAMGSGGQWTENLGYGYDPAWNLNKRTNVATVTTFTVDAKDQLTTVGATSYTYDSNGNLTAEGTGKVFTYDAENQLVSVYTTGGYMYRYDFVYDGRGRLRRRVDYTCTTNWVVTGETRYVYDGMRMIQERNSSNVPTVSYTRGQDLSGSLEGAGGIGGLLARSDQYSSGSMTRHACYFADGNGNVVNLVDAASAHTVWATYRYNPYGASTYSSGTLASANVYRFSSKEFLANPAIYYFGYRWYDPNLQRWLNRDPLQQGGGINLYTFVDNQPVDSIDPYGLESWLCKRAINKPPGTPPPAKGRFFHQYYCVQLWPSKEIKCYGQTADKLWGPGKPSSPKDDAYDPSTCSPIKDGSDCLDRCLTRKGKEKRPYYGFVGPGTNCQEWSNNAIDACLKECPPACNSPFTANTYESTH